MLEYVSGGLAHKGITKRCQIYDDHPALTREVSQQIERAERAEMRTLGVYRTPRVPSEEYLAYRHTDGKPVTVELFRDYGRRTGRSDADSQALIKLVHGLCAMGLDRGLPDVASEVR